MTSHIKSIASVPMIALLLLFAIAATHTVQSQGMHTVSVETLKGNFSWNVELASDDASRSKGLMFRKSMPQDAGMLFRFDQTRPVAMWMKNTFIPLDMIFTDESGIITHIHKNAVPHSEDIITSRGPVRFVLEVNSGVADAVALTKGMKLNHPWFTTSN